MQLEVQVFHHSWAKYWLSSRNVAGDPCTDALSSMMTLKVTSPTQFKGWLFVSTSSDRIIFVLDMSKFTLNLNGFLPVEGRGDIWIVVGILIFSRLSGLAPNESLKLLFWFVEGVAWLVPEIGLIFTLSAQSQFLYELRDGSTLVGAGCSVVCRKLFCGPLLVFSHSTGFRFQSFCTLHSCWNLSIWRKVQSVVFATPLTALDNTLLVVWSHLQELLRNLSYV